MENEFAKVMSERSDEQLIKIVTVERERYNPTAIEAADAEFAKRNIDISVFEKIRDQAQKTKETQAQIDSQIASSGIRFLNFIIDFIVWWVLAFIVIFIVAQFMPLYDENIISFVYYALLIGTYFSYYSFMEIRYQKTIGKFLTKTRVVSIHGDNPNKSNILIRTLCRFIPFDRISFLLVKNGIHDYLSKTKVVKD